MDSLHINFLLHIVNSYNTMNSTNNIIKIMDVSKLNLNFSIMAMDLIIDISKRAGTYGTLVNNEIFLR